ncbi:hypothetical protein CURTO8I2_210103 [Curtobacterium sp. 8I-2]|nr:hypothetical protein CURTO8I2_210103 [Curtobacterium sp. 8I-2]
MRGTEASVGRPAVGAGVRRPAGVRRLRADDRHRPAIGSEAVPRPVRRPRDAAPDLQVSARYSRTVRAARRGSGPRRDMARPATVR